MTRAVTLVTGPPCAGKSTHVAQHARPGDIVLDQDVIGAAAMRAGLAHVAAMTTGTAWVIRCCPGPTRRQALAAQLRATDVLLLRPDDAELLARAARRPHPRRHIQAVRDWISRETHDDRGPHDKPRGGTSRGATPRTTTQRGYGWQHQQARAKAITRMYDGQPCTRCGQPMYRDEARLLDLDHTDDRTTYRGLAHRSCNRRAGQAAAQQSMRARRTTTQRTRNVVNSRAW